MKSKFESLAAITLLSATSMTAAFAHEDYSEGGSWHWLAHVAQATGGSQASSTAPVGQGASEENRHMSMDHTPSAAEKARKPDPTRVVDGAGEENKHWSMNHSPVASR